VIVRFIDDHRDQYGIEPICAVLPIAPSTYYRHHARQLDPTLRPARALRDDVLRPEIQRVYDEHHQVYGPRKVWKQLRREGVRVARCTVGRLMRTLGLAGAVRGRAWITTTHAGDGGRPADLVDRQFVATRPNQLWVSDFTYVATWGGFVYVAFVIDVFARRIVGWRVSASMRTDFVLDALEQAIYARSSAPLTGLVHHSDRGTQGEFNRSLQQLYREKLQWVLRSDVGLIARGAAPSVHQVVRRRDVVNIDRSSGRPSRAVCRAGMQHSKRAYRNRLERGGSAKMAACHRLT
jgi:putative transposase